jgi:hypothetical protein
VLGVLSSLCQVDAASFAGALTGTTATVGIIDLIMYSRVLAGWVIYNWYDMLTAIKCAEQRKKII